MLKEKFRNVTDVTSVGIWTQPEGTEIAGSMTNRIEPTNDQDLLAAYADI